MTNRRPGPYDSRMKLGGISINPVIDGTARIVPSYAYTIANSGSNTQGLRAEDWLPHLALLDKDGMLEQAIGGFLIRSGDRVLLVDAGLGEFDSSLSEEALAKAGLMSPWIPGDGGHLLAEMASLGVSPDDVTDVLFTHLHTDHIGWATHSGRPVFRNATYRCDERDWAHFARPGTPVGDHLLPLSGQLETWSGTTSIAPGVDAQPAPGHTPGSAMIILSAGAERAMLLGDVVHCPVELLDDEWAGMGDLDPVLAARTREAMAREIEGGQVPVAGAHFPGMQFGRLLRAEGKRSWVFGD